MVWRKKFLRESEDTYFICGLGEDESLYKSEEEFVALQIKARQQANSHGESGGPNYEL